MEMQIKRYERAELTKQEINRLRKMVLGYGNLQRVADRLGMHRNTVRLILDKGYGKPETIETIRLNLMGE